MMPETKYGNHEFLRHVDWLYSAIAVYLHETIVLHDSFVSQRAWRLYLDTVLSLQVYLLQLRLWRLSGKRTRALC